MAQYWTLCQTKQKFLQRRLSMSNNQHALPIIRTKLYRPPVTPDYVSRSGLDALLDSGADLPLTVVSAPAGYGKSTLISHWLESCALASAWLSLDDSDSDVRVFLNYVVAAIRTHSAAACTKTLEVINAETLQQIPVIVTHLSNDLEELDERLILVLDDFHRIHEPDIYSILDLLLKHPSRNLHIVVVSRRDPLLSLASLRASHLLNEIRMRDLEFSGENTHAFIEQVARLSLDARNLSRLQDKTEGWPVGIRLVALALQHQENVDGFLDRFGADARPLQEYLVEEVLSGQSPHIQDCLLRTSILNRFNASLCEAVWDDDNVASDALTSGKKFIETLEKSSLFYVALDERKNWYRFHHIFSDLLRKQLEEKVNRQEIARLHQRASHWFAENGQYEEAIQHALVGGDDDGAAKIAGHARHDLMNRDQWHRLERWLKQFSHEAVQQSPQLILLRCWLDLSHWYRLDLLVRDLDRASGLLESMTLDGHKVDQLKAEISALRTSLAYWTVNPSQVLSLADQALRDSAVEQEYIRSIAVMYMGGAYQLLGKVQQGTRLLWDHMEEDRFNHPNSQARLLQALCFMYWPENDTRKLRQAASRLLDISSQHDMYWSYSFARYFLGLIHYERNELSEAVTQFESIAGDPYRYPIQNVTHCSFLLSMSYQAQGLGDKAREVARSINKLTIECGNRMFIELAEAFQAELDLRQGHITLAGRWANAFELPPPHVLHRFFNAELTSIRIMMAQETLHDNKAAREQLDRLHELLIRSHNQRMLIDVLGMKALLADTEEDVGSAVALLQEAVHLGQPGQLIRPLADLGPGLVKLLNRLDLDQEGLCYVGSILSALQEPGEGHAEEIENQPLIEALSQRELEILRLFSRSLSNKEIAERLFISPGTVKRHAHNIYGKLSVGGRRDAVAKAKGLGILKSS